LVITFGLTAIFHSVVYAIAARKRRLHFFYVGQYIDITVFFSLLYLFFYSLYKSKGPATVLNYLSQSFNIKFVMASFLISSVLLFLYEAFKKRDITLVYKFCRVPGYVIIALWVFLFLVNASFEFTVMYGMVPVEQFIFHLALPRTGANFEMVRQLFINPFINSIFMLIFSLYVLSSKINIGRYSIFVPFQKYKKVFLCIAALLPAAGIISAVTVIELPQYLLGTFEKSSTLYEEHYIVPDDVEVTFPAEKRNLIVIVIESLETGFLTVENGGAFTEDLMPEITELAKNNINFSGSSGIGGVVQLYGTEWTAAGIVSYYSGVPLAVSFLNQTEWNNYGQLSDEFLPGASGVGDILHDAGYNGYFFLGSDIAFGGRDKYFKNHKNTVIFDYNYFKNNNFIPKNYNVWWGIEDRKLYRFSKDIILDIAKEGPFFITFLTADTHPSGGYLDEEAEEVFDFQYKNVLRDTSKQLSAFVGWIQDQDFYENTTIVILGDHLYQDSSIFPGKFKIQKLSSKYEKDYFIKNDENAYNRYPLNIFINSLLNPDGAKGKSLSHFDMFPLLLESIGGVYDAEGLGLGRSLYSGETLVGKYGSAAMNEQLRRKSELYNTLWKTKR
jgi:phosphoglycerol transferase